MNIIKCICSFFILIFFMGCASSPYHEADQLLEKREFDKAIRAYLGHLDPHSRDGKRYIYFDREATTGIGRVYWQMQKYETAAKIFSMVLAKEPLFGKANFYLGLSYESLDKEADAIYAYRKYVMLDRFDPYRKIMMGRMDYLVKNKIAQEIQTVFQNENQLNAIQPSQKSVAVLYFMNLSESSEWDALQKGLAEMLITDLSQIKALQVVERVKMNYIMDELKLSASGLVEESSSPRMGKLLGAKVFVKGSYMIMPDNRMKLDASIYQPDAVYLPSTSNYEGNLSRLFRMEKELVLAILNYLEIEMTPMERERILIIPTENMEAFMQYCRGLDALDKSDFDKAQNYFKKALKIDRNFQLARDKLMNEKIWDAAHGRNLVRLSHEAVKFANVMRRRVKYELYDADELVSVFSRQRLMGVYQNNGFLPGNDTRKSFEEAEEAMLLVPRLLGEPPNPPSLEN